LNYTRQPLILLDLPPSRQPGFIRSEPGYPSARPHQYRLWSICKISFLDTVELLHQHPSLAADLSSVIATLDVS